MKKTKRVAFDSKGNIVVEEIATPQSMGNGVLSKTCYSLISSGTETSTIKKVRDEVRGRSALSKLKSRFRATSPLGYSNSGYVIDKGSRCKNIQIGDRIACCGNQYAHHSSIVSVPRNLFAKIPDAVEYKDACFAAVASVAMHGIRRSKLEFGDTVAILGQGLVGQLCNQFAKIAGARTIVTDLHEKRLEISKKLGANLAVSAKNDPVKHVMDYTDGAGADKILICVGGDISGLFSQGAKMARDRATIVLVGRGFISFRDSIFYSKELELLATRAYGPGRYDQNYEQEGHDYPIGYVRWTENRNMMEYLRFVAEKRVKVEPLITHEFSVEDAPKGYDQLMQKPEETLAVVLRYS